MKPLAETWRERANALNARLDAEPHHPCAWQWRMEAKILRVLARRYPDQEREMALGPSRLALWVSGSAMNAHPKKRSVTPSERAAMLRNIAQAGDEARASRGVFDALSAIYDAGVESSSYQAFGWRQRRTHKREQRQQQRDFEAYLRAQNAAKRERNGLN